MHSPNDIVEESRLISHDVTDVPNALKRATDDGKGESEPSPSNWNGYATEGVIRED